MQRIVARVASLIASSVSVVPSQCAHATLEAWSANTPWKSDHESTETVFASRYAFARANRNAWNSSSTRPIWTPSPFMLSVSFFGRVLDEFQAFLFARANAYRE